MLYALDAYKAECRAWTWTTWRPWGDGSNSVGIGCGAAERPNSWGGDLIAVADGWFGDFAIHQAERLQYGIVTGLGHRGAAPGGQVAGDPAGIGQGPGTRLLLWLWRMRGQRQRIRTECRRGNREKSKTKRGKYTCKNC